MQHLLKSNIRLLFCMVIIVIMISDSSAQQVTLGWSPSRNETIQSYGIYRAIHVDSNYTLINTVAHPETTYLDDTTQWEQHYYYAATSIDDSGIESNFSNIVDTSLTQSSPVELSLFSGYCRINDVIIKWSTATESDNYGFEIQRSRNNFTNPQTIKFIRGGGTCAIPRYYEFIDRNLKAGTYYYRLKQIDFDGDYEFSDIIEVSVQKPVEFLLNQNYPNPFNATTRISYSLKKGGPVELVIFEVNGKEVNRLVDKYHEPGVYHVTWDGTNNQGIPVASGRFYYKIKSPSGTKFRRMILLK